MGAAPETDMRIEKLLQMPENRIRWVEMIKRHEAMRTSWNDRAKEAAALVKIMQAEAKEK